MFKNLTIKLRLILILSFLLLFVLGIQMVGLFGMSSAIGDLKTVYHDRTIPLSQVTHIESLLLQNRLAISAAIIMPTREAIETKMADVEKNIGIITRTWEAYISTNLTHMEHKLAVKFALDHTRYITEGILPAVAALRADKIDEANRILVEKIRPLYPSVDETIEALVLLQIDETKITYFQEQQRYETIRNILIASIVAALVLAALFSLVFIRAVFRPLEDVVSIARSVAAGNLRQEIEIRSKDEIGQLMQALKEMRDSLVDTIGQVRGSEAHTRALLNNLIVGVTSVDEQGLIRTFNPAAERIFGYPQNEIIGQNLGLLFPEPEQGQGRHIHYLENYLKKGAKALDVTTEVTALRKNGATFPLDIAVVEMHGGERRMFAVILRDISERKLVEEQKAGLMADLESANEELKSFAYVVSHDLKAPLRAIGALADWLSTDYADKFDDEGREHMRLLVNRVHRMGNLIDGILQYSRVGRVRETPVMADLNEVVQDAIELLAPPSSVISIIVENSLPTILIEPTRIQQIFQNLLSNSIKYMDKPHGEIRVACSAEGEQWKFSITDNGPGIESRHFERIFQLFQTLAPRDRIESTGVGLALVKKIVEMYGGNIWIESTIGNGSSFFFTLPQTAPKSLT